MEPGELQIDFCRYNSARRFQEFAISIENDLWMPDFTLFGYPGNWMGVLVSRDTPRPYVLLAHNDGETTYNSGTFRNVEDRSYQKSLLTLVKKGAFPEQILAGAQLVENVARGQKEGASYCWNISGMLREYAAALQGAFKALPTIDTSLVGVNVSVIK